MEKQNVKWSKLMRRVSQMLILLMFTVSFTTQASALILFQDDAFHDIASEGIIINSDDGGDEDVTLQFGNDSTDATIIFDDGTGDITLATPGGTFSFSNDDLTTTGALLFSGSSEFHIRENADPATNSACTTLDELIIDTTDNELQICTATGIAGAATWTNIASGATQDFESVYSADADNTLTASGAFDIAAIGAINIDSNVGVLVGGATIDIDSNGGAVAINDSVNQAVNIATGTSTGLVTIGGGSGTAAINTTSWDISSAGVASGFTGFTSTGTVNFSGAGEFRMRENADPTTNSACTTLNELILDTTDNQIQICTATGIAGAATWVGIGAGTLDGLDSTQFLRSDTSDSYTAGTLTFDNGTTLTVNGAANLGDGGDAITINTSSWDISGTGAASGFTTFTGSGDITTTAGDLVIGTVGLNDTGAGVSGGGLVGFDNLSSANLSSTTVQGAIDEIVSDFGSTANGNGASLIGVEDAGGYFTATNVEATLQEIGATTGANAPNVDEMTFEAEYPNAVVFQDGTTNRGRLDALYDSTNLEQYYRWVTRRTIAAQDIDIRFRYELPADYVAGGDMTLKFRTDTITATDNSVAVTVRNDTDGLGGTTCHADAAATGAIAATWETLTITAAEIATGCTGATALNAGDIIEVQIKMVADNTNSGGTDVGTLVYDYTN